MERVNSLHNLCIFEAMIYKYLCLGGKLILVGFAVLYQKKIIIVSDWFPCD